MNKLLGQVAKFGVVGVLCFAIDFGVYTALNMLFRRNGFADSFDGYYLVSKFVSVVVSMVCNYLLSMKFVFARKDDMSRGKEFVIFVLLSAVGLVISEVILYLGMDVITPAWHWLRATVGSIGSFFGMTEEGSLETFWVLVSTAVVMCYNFISRKMALEKRGA